METVTILEYSLGLFAAELQKAVQQGYVMNPDGANFWGRSYECTMEKSSHVEASVAIVPAAIIAAQVEKKVMGRPARK